MGDNNMAEFEALFGGKILTKDGKKNIMVYFSAHWCPPCRGYTPDLSSAYEGSDKKDETAVVFVSSDRDQAAFDEYYASMSFFAVCTPYVSIPHVSIVCFKSFRSNNDETAIVMCNCRSPM